MVEATQVLVELKDPLLVTSREKINQVEAHMRESEVRTHPLLAARSAMVHSVRSRADWYSFHTAGHQRQGRFTQE